MPAMASRYAKTRSKADTVHEAAELGSLAKLEEHIKEGIERGYPESVTLQEREDVLGMMPLHVACEYGQLAVVKYLISKRVDIDAGDNFRVTAMHLAAIENHCAIIKALLDARGSMRPFDVEGDQPIHWAATKGHVEVIKMLLAWGAPADTPNNQGWTPLHRAAYNGRTAAIEVLVVAGASMQSVTKDGMTPLHCACFMNQLVTIEKLCSMGAKQTPTNARGQTPTDLCITDAAREILQGYGGCGPHDRKLEAGMPSIGAGSARRREPNLTATVLPIVTKLPAPQLKEEDPDTVAEAAKEVAKLAVSGWNRKPAMDGFPSPPGSPTANDHMTAGYNVYGEESTQFMHEATGHLESITASPYLAGRMPSATAPEPGQIPRTSVSRRSSNATGYMR